MFCECSGTIWRLAPLTPDVPGEKRALKGGFASQFCGQRARLRRLGEKKRPGLDFFCFEGRIGKPRRETPNQLGRV